MISVVPYAKLQNKRAKTKLDKVSIIYVFVLNNLMYLDTFVLVAVTIGK